MRRNITIGIVVLALVVAGFFLLRQRRQAAQEPTFEIIRSAEVARGKITATVNATGTIEPEALVTLTFGASGTVQDVNVTRGQRVAAGDVLATLDTAELQLTVKQAEDALRIQELNLEQRLNSEPSPATLASAEADIAAAEANLQVAQANLASAEAAVLQAQAQKALLQAGPTPGQVAAAESAVEQARLNQKNAQEAYNRTIECFEITLPDGSTREECPGLGAPEEQARAALANANAALAAAEAQLQDLYLGPRAADLQAADAAIASAEAGVLAAQGNVAAAEAQLARAKAAYDRLLEGPTDEEVAILEAQIESARTNLELAQLRLDQAIIKAPFAGTVASVLINEGEQATPGAPAITIVDEDAFHITVNVDEIDIDRVEVGQTVEVTLDALPDVVVPGVVSEVAPTSANTSGVVTYLVTVNITADDSLELRPGMSANAAIVVEEVDGVLYVPNWAIRLNRETGEAFVNVQQADGSVTEVVVETGLRNEQFSEVVSGLQEGDVVVVTNERETLNFFGN